MCSGVLVDRSRSLTHAFSSSSLTALPGSSTTVAATASPHSRVRHADHRRFGHRRVAQQRVLDLAR